MSREIRPPMTYRRREEILSKESIHYTELAELLGIDESTAGKKMQEIKRVIGDRLNIKGRLHIQDYLDWVAKSGSLCTERYKIPFEDAEPEEREPIKPKPSSVFTMPSDEIRQKFNRKERAI